MLYPDTVERFIKSRVISAQKKVEMLELERELALLDAKYDIDRENIIQKQTELIREAEKLGWR